MIFDRCLAATRDAIVCHRPIRGERQLVTGDTVALCGIHLRAYDDTLAETGDPRAAAFRVLAGDREAVPS